MGSYPFRDDATEQTALPPNQSETTAMPSNSLKNVISQQPIGVMFDTAENI